MVTWVYQVQIMFNVSKFILQYMCKYDWVCKCSLTVGIINNVILACLLFSDAKRTMRLKGRTTAVVVAKRNANDKPSDDDCVIYRYGSFCTGIEILGGLLFIRAVFIWTNKVKHLKWPSVMLLSSTFLFSEAIEKVSIVQIDKTVKAMSGKDTNVLDITVTCQGRWVFVHYILSQLQNE